MFMGPRAIDTASAMSNLTFAIVDMIDVFLTKNEVQW